MYNGRGYHPNPDPINRLWSAPFAGLMGMLFAVIIVELAGHFSGARAIATTLIVGFMVGGGLWVKFLHGYWNTLFLKRLTREP
jgi:hypothetical protein